MKASENNVVNAVCEYLEWKGYFFWRQNNMSVYDPVRKQYRAMPKYSKKGVPDIIVVHKGQFIGLECKQKGKYLSPEQKAFKEGLEIAGGRYEMVRCIADVQKMGL